MMMQELYVKVCTVQLFHVNNIAFLTDNIDQANCSNGEVRLVDGNSLNEGRVEVCVNEAWGTICSSGWNDVDAFVVCRQLGYLPLGIIIYTFKSLDDP